MEQQVPYSGRFVTTDKLKHGITVFTGFIAGFLTAFYQNEGVYYKYENTSR